MKSELESNSFSNNKNILNPNQTSVKGNTNDYAKINTLKFRISKAKDSVNYNTNRNDFAWKIAKVNSYIQKKKLDSAISIVNSLNTTDSIENELVTVYKILGKLELQKQKLSPIEEEQILKIARKNQYTSSIASPLARIIVKQTMHIDIYDSLEFIPTIKGSINKNCGGFYNLAGIKVRLLNQNNSETGLFAITNTLGHFTFSNSQLSQYSPSAIFKFVCTLPDSSKAQSVSNNLGGFMQTKDVVLSCKTILSKKQNEKLEVDDNIHLPKIYPNPNNGKFIIECDEAIEIQIFDLLGKEILTQNVSNKTNIDLSGQPKGIYFVKVIGKENYNFKLLIE